MKIIQGDLIKHTQEGLFDVIVHGNNCFCEMGAGIAKQLSDMYPEVLIADCKTIPGATNKLGTFTYVKVKDGFIVVNAYTQYEYGMGRHADYKAIRECFNAIKKSFTGKRIGYPLIGAGMAGGKWDTIKEIIDQELVGEDHTLVEWKAGNKFYRYNNRS